MSGQTKAVKTQPFKKGVKYIHVNQHVIRECTTVRKQVTDGKMSKEEADLTMPDAMTMKFNGSNIYGSVFIVTHPETGEEVGRFEHKPFNPYSCGAQIVFMTIMNVEVLSRGKNEGSHL